MGWPGAAPGCASKQVGWGGVGGWGAGPGAHACAWRCPGGDDWQRAQQAHGCGSRRAVSTRRQRSPRASSMTRVHSSDALQGARGQQTTRRGARGRLQAPLSGPFRAARCPAPQPRLPTHLPAHAPGRALCIHPGAQPAPASDIGVPGGASVKGESGAGVGWVGPSTHSQAATGSFEPPGSAPYQSAAGPTLESSAKARVYPCACVFFGGGRGAGGMQG